jgi:DNA-binding transcriptional ArsR family regulator
VSRSGSRPWRRWGSIWRSSISPRRWIPGSCPPCRGAHRATHLSICLTIFGLGTILKYMPNRPVAELDRIFHALADPSRRSMVERLARSPASVSQLGEPLAMSLAAVVQHLGVLEEAGIVVSQKVGRVRTCQLAPGALRRAEGWLVGQRSRGERLLDRLSDLLAEPDDGTQDRS